MNASAIDNSVPLMLKQYIFINVSFVNVIRWDVFSAHRSWHISNVNIGIDNKNPEVAKPHKARDAYK